MRSSRLRSNNKHLAIVKNKISVGDIVEVLSPTKHTEDTIVNITDLTGNTLNEINPGRDDQKANINLKHKYTKDSFIRKPYN